jgi:hypothetical protein
MRAHALPFCWTLDSGQGYRFRYQPKHTYRVTIGWWKLRPGTLLGPDVQRLVVPITIRTMLDTLLERILTLVHSGDTYKSINIIMPSKIRSIDNSTPKYYSVSISIS